MCPQSSLFLGQQLKGFRFWLTRPAIEKPRAANPACGSEEAVCQQVEQTGVEGNRGAENVVMEPVVTGFNAFALHRILMVKTI